jgi:hypothetical protein
VQVVHDRYHGDKQSALSGLIKARERQDRGGGDGEHREKGHETKNHTRQRTTPRYREKRDQRKRKQKKRQIEQRERERILRAEESRR